MAMNFDRALFHDISIDTLYAGIVLLFFIIVERSLTYVWLGSRVRKIARQIALKAAGAAASLPHFEGRDILSRSMAEYAEAQQREHMSRNNVEDLSAALFMEVDEKVSARLWILDTIVTAAPLLGLLGTILGIMDTFNALSSGGISDPAAVSRGIASALLATALGIGTALFGLLGHNILHRQAEGISEAFKGFMLRTTI
jgi:biopolymer transport protein ExbB